MKRSFWQGVNLLLIFGGCVALGYVTAQLFNALRAYQHRYQEVEGAPDLGNFCDDVRSWRNSCQLARKI